MAWFTDRRCDILVMDRQKVYVHQNYRAHKENKTCRKKNVMPNDFQ